MIIKAPERGFPSGYTAISEEDGSHADMLMDFGLLRMKHGETYRCSRKKERAFLLMNGRVTFSWAPVDPAGNAGVKFDRTCERYNLLDEDPVALHVPSGTEVEISALDDDVEIAVQRVTNAAQFAPRLWMPGDYRSDRFGEGTLQDTSTRTVRTIFDAATAQESAMVLGEVVNNPGKWSSYPPHDHAQPEVYHYRFFPAQGWGHAEQEDEVFKVKSGDTYAIPPHVTHSQCAAPGYAMYYIWMIPHLPGDRFGPDSRNFRSEHTWVMNSAAPIWPDADLTTVLEHHGATRKEDR